MVRVYGLAVAVLLKGCGRIIVATAIQRSSSELGHYRSDRHREDFVTDPDFAASILASVLGQEASLLTRVCRHPAVASARAPHTRRTGKRQRTQASFSHPFDRCITIVHELSSASAAKMPGLHVRGGGNAPSTPPWSARVFGSSGPMEAKTEEEEMRAKEAEDAATREALRQAREDRLERERAECSVGREAPTDREESKDEPEGSSILLTMTTAGSAPRKISPPEYNRLWIDVAEGFVGGISLAATSLYPLFHTLRALFGLSLLFYGQEFATLAFHIVVFRLSGWKKAAKSKDELVTYYKKARQAMAKAATDVRATAALVARNDRLKSRKEEMMMEKKRLLEDGRVTAEEARAFIDKYRLEIEFIAREQEALATASSSVLAIKGALSLKKLSASLKSLYSAVVTSITASTFKRAGQLTLALTCGGLIKKTLFDLLGPVIDPIGYQIELETYIANAMRGPANLYISLVGFATSALMFFHFFVDPRQALTITFVFLGARVVTDYIVAGLNPVRWRFGVSKKIENMPLSAVIYLCLVSLGFAFQQNAGVIGDYVCRPFIAFLRLLNKMLNHFQISTISYFS